MRKTVILATVAGALCACQTPESLQRQAAANCQAVGISEKDPQFKTCSEAFSRQYLEDQLNTNYRNALNPAPDDRRIAHVWVY
jgi:hypothetical protein